MSYVPMHLHIREIVKKLLLKMLMNAFIVNEAMVLFAQVGPIKAVWLAGV